MKSAEDRRAWWAFFAVCMTSAIYYSLQNNGLWMPRNDASYYLAIGRSVARGDGLVFNGDPVTLVPPGWPAVLAAFMRISPSFEFLNSVTIIAMALTCGVWVWVLRRLASLPVVLGIISLCAILFDWYTAAVQLRSEALYCLLFSCALLVGFQIVERKPLAWRLPVLLVLCAASVAVRWAGIVNWLVIAGVLLTGELKPRLQRQWVSAALSGGVIFLTFFGLRHYQADLFPQKLAAKYEREIHQLDDVKDPAAAFSSDPASLEERVGHLPPDPGEATLRRGPPKARPMEGLFTRASGAPALEFFRVPGMGLWWTSLFWKPAYLAVAVPFLEKLANLFGWFFIALYVWAALAEARQRRWLLASAVLVSLALVIRWPNLRPMYLMPMAPLLLLGIWKGLRDVRGRLTGGVVRVCVRSFVWAAVLSVVVVNVALFAVDAWVACSRDYYGRYFAGRAKTLLSIASYLGDVGVEDGEIGINRTYQNLNRTVPNGFALRNLNLLLDRIILELPLKFGSRMPDEGTFAAARRMGIRYLIWRPPVSPWQVWHFRAPALQKRITGSDEIEENPTWILYEITPDGGEQVRVPDLTQADLPRSLVGLGEQGR